MNLADRLVAEVADARRHVQEGQHITALIGVRDNHRVGEKRVNIRVHLRETAVTDAEVEVGFALQGEQILRDDVEQLAVVQVHYHGDIVYSLVPACQLRVIGDRGRVPGHDVTRVVQVGVATAAVGLQVGAFAPLVPGIDENHSVFLGQMGLGLVDRRLQPLAIQLGCRTEKRDRSFHLARGVVPRRHHPAVVQPGRSDVVLRTLGGE